MQEDYKKYPKLREDLKVSKMLNKSNQTHYVVKDPLKETYFRFGEDEWEIISLFDGNQTMAEMVQCFNNAHEFSEIDESIVEDYWNNLNSMNLLVKSHEEMNVMLVEKVKEMRQFQLLSKKGSIMYKRFPLVDPDKWFDKVIPHIRFFWSKAFFIFSITCMIISTAIIFANWTKFNNGLYELFNFSEMSFTHIAVLWFVIYLTIAIHELGHGLTCKYYGGEVHEIGFLLLFFQPCLYANVNDAWLFDKKWKQIMVTIAGGYIEYFIGSLATFVWVFTSPNTFINIISFQIMTIASISTIMFNFNPLIKLDGYYLLSDYLEAPNLKEESAKYLKYLCRKYIFKIPSDKFYATKREKKVYFCYGVASTIWMTLLLTGLVGLAKGILVDKFHALGMLMTAFIAYKIFGSYVSKSIKFLVSWFLHHKEILTSQKVKRSFGIGITVAILFLFIPIHYKIKGSVTINPSKMLILRPVTNGEIVSFYKNDGEVVNKGDKVFKLENISTKYDRVIASLAVEKANIKLRKTIVNDPQKIYEAKKELKSKQLKLNKKILEEEMMVTTYKGELGDKSILSCEKQERIVGSFYKKGDEVCRLYDLNFVKSLIEVSEQDVAFLREGQEVDFKLFSNPLKTFNGKINSIRPTGKGDPKNPTRKIYMAEIEIKNDGSLRSGMNGMAKIYGNKVSVFKYGFTKLTSALRLDLFY